MSRNHQNHRVHLHVERLEDRCVPATITVTKLDDAIGAPGLNLREAVDKANLTAATDTIVFQKGLKGTITLSGTEIPITESLTINGPSANLITISGNEASRIFNVDDGDLVSANRINVTIRKLSLTKGAPGAAGGAIFNKENLTVIKARFFGNQATNGGAIFSQNGILTVSSCSFFDNRADNDGGAIVNTSLVFSSEVSTISNCTFSENRSGSPGTLSGHGGAIYSGWNTELTRCTFTGNAAVAATSLGGAIYHDTLKLTMRFCTVSGNASAGASGGIEIEDEAEIHNSTIAHNTANANGGGIRIAFGGDVLLSNSTVSGNWADGNGGGIAVGASDSLIVHNSTIAFNRALGNGGGIWADNPVALTSTIVARNLAATAGNDLFSVDPSPGDQFTLQNCLIEDPAGFNLVNLGGTISGVDPRLGPLASNGGPTQTHALLPDSPAINGGLNMLGVLYDQRGPFFKRLKGGSADIGAFELK